MTSRLLLASIHDVGPAFESEIDALFARLTGLLHAVTPIRRRLGRRAAG